MGFNPIGALSSAVSTVTNTVQDAAEAVGNVVENAVETVTDSFESNPDQTLAGIQGCCDVGASRNSDGGQFV